MKTTNVMNIISHAAEIAVRWPILLSIYVKANPKSTSRRISDVLDWYIQIGGSAAENKTNENEFIEADFVEVKE